LYPTVQATKDYADALVVGLLNDRGSWDASTNLFPTTGGSGLSGAIRKGDMWFVSVDGILAGKNVTIGDSFRALVNIPGQTATNWSVLESNIGYVPENVSNKSDSYTLSSSTTYASTKSVVDGLATKQNTLTNPITGTGTNNQIAAFTGTNTITSLSIATYPSLTELSYVKGVTSAVQPQLNSKISFSAATVYSFPSITGSNTIGTSKLFTDSNGFVKYSDNGGAETAYVGFNVYNTMSPYASYFEGGSGTNTKGVGLGTTSNVPFIQGTLDDFSNTAPLSISGGGSDTYYGSYADNGSGAKHQFTGSLYSNSNIMSAKILAGTISDNGNIGRFAGTVDVNKIQLNTTPATASGTPPLLTWNNTTKDVESVPYATFAPIASPTFTGTPTAPTATVGTNTTQIATTAFVIENTKQEVLSYACSDETTNLTVGTLVTFRMPFGFTLTSVRASVNTAPTVSSIIVDVKEGGASIFSTLLSIDATEKTSITAATPAVISDTSLADDAEITISTTQIGSGVAGAGLKITLIGTRT